MDEMEEYWEYVSLMRIREIRYLQLREGEVTVESYQE